MSQIKGARIVIQHAEDEHEKNFFEVLDAAFAKDEQKRKIAAKTMAMLKRLADGGQLRNPDQMNTESNLPDGKKYFAIKPHKHVRVYGWFSSKHKGTFFISHFSYKNAKKLSAEDDNRVIQNWRNIEG